MFAWMMAMLVGIATASFAPLSEAVLVLLQAYGFLAMLVAASLCMLSRLCGSNRLLVLLSPLVGCFFAAFLYAALHASQMHQHILLSEHEGELVEFQATVIGLPRQEYRYGKPVQRFDVAVATTRWPVSDLPLRRLRLSWYGGPSVKAGQQWRLRAKLKRPRGLANPGGFDYQLYLHQQGIDAVGYIRWGERAYFDNSLRIRWQAATAALRYKLAQSLDSVDSDYSYGRLLRALSVGDGKALTVDDWELLRRTGTTHLFVISGLHIGMLAGLVYLLSLHAIRRLSPLAKGLVSHRLAALLACAAALFYAMLAGLSLPTQRAVVMLGIGLIGRSYGLAFRLPSVLAFTALSVLLAEPLAIRSAGFCLSFAAVGALLYAFSGRINGHQSWLRSLLLSQWVSFVALSPLLLFWFNSTALSMPIANLVAVPVMAMLIVPMVMLCLALASFGIELPVLLLTTLDKSLALLWSFLQRLANFSDGAAQLNMAIGPLELALVLLAGLITLAPSALASRFKFAIPFLLLPLFIPALVAAAAAARVDTVGLTHAAEDDNCPRARFTVLDVGQGLSAVFSFEGKTLVYDTGAAFSPSFEAGGAVLAPYLRSLGVFQVDSLVISHADNDHYGGYQGLRKHLPIAQVQASFHIPEHNAQRCKAGQVWNWQGVNFEFLSPGLANSGDQSDKNNQSCVLKITAAGFSVLLTGDIEREAEQALIAYDVNKLAADIMLMPHHGSKTSSSAEFLQAVGAHYAIASAAYKGRFGHPHTEVVNRYQRFDSQILNTATAGAIEFDLPVCAGEAIPEPKLYRRQAGNYWLGW